MFLNSTDSDRFFSLSRPHAHHLSPFSRSPFPLPPNAICRTAHRAAHPAAQTDYLTPSAALAPSVICFVRDWWHVRQQASNGKGTVASSRGEGKADDSLIDPFPCRRAFSIAALRLENQRYETFCKNRSFVTGEIFSTTMGAKLAPVITTVSPPSVSNAAPYHMVKQPMVTTHGDNTTKRRFNQG